MNKVTLMGRLTKNPEVRYTPNNTIYTTFILAVNKNIRERYTRSRFYKHSSME